MGDAALNTPAHQSSQDRPSNGNSAKDDDCASSIKIGHLPELQSSSLDSQRMEEDEPYSGKDHAPAQPAAAQSDASSFNDKLALFGYSQNSSEGNLDGDGSGDCSLLSMKLQNCEERIVDQVDTLKERANMLHLDKAEESPSVSKGPTREECAELDHGRSIQSSDGSRATLTEKLENAKGDDLDKAESPSISKSPREECAELDHGLSIHSSDDSRAISISKLGNAKGDDYPPCKILVDTEDVNLKEKRGEFAEESGSPDEGSRSSCITPSILKGSVSNDTFQPSLFLPSNESGQQQNQATNELTGDSEILPPSTCTGKGEVRDGFQSGMESFLDPSNQEWSDLDFCEATLISIGVEGWQRFDADEGVTGMDYTPGADQRGIEWEQLLDDGLDGTRKNDVIHPLQLALPPPHTENQLELASPGNPFIEGLDKVSSFSEEAWPLRPKEGLKAHRDPSSGTATVTEGIVESNLVNEQKTKSHMQSSTSLDFMEPFEAPSFMSLVDPKSHALFEASMPTYQATRAGYGHENSEEKWVASFDLVAPYTQEITRSISMPRPGFDTPDQRPGQSVSFTVNREQEPSKEEGQSPSAHRSIAGFLSPKLNPLIQKVVDKVRSTPAAANGVFNSVRQVMSPKASSKKSTSGSLLTRCICW